MLSTLLSSLSVLLAAIGIPLLYFQLRDVKRSLRSAAHAAIYSQAETLRGHLIDHPHLRKYFFDKEEITPKNKDYDRVVSIAEIYLNYFEHIAVLQNSFGKRNISSLHRFIKTAFDKSPIIQKYLNENSELYSDALHDLLKDITPSLNDERDLPNKQT